MQFVSQMDTELQISPGASEFERMLADSAPTSATMTKPRLPVCPWSRVDALEDLTILPPLSSTEMSGWPFHTKLQNTQPGDPILTPSVEN